jgi:glycerophosphoryl diester phosphodiesterase
MKNPLLTSRLAVLGWLLAPVLASAVEIVAHRGASHDAPENTVAAAKLAWEQNADAVELDIWLTKDGQVAVMHDGNAKRTAGRDAHVTTLTLAEMKQLDAGRWKNPSFAGEKVPSLDEMLATLPAGKRIFIEIKPGPEIVPAMVASLQRMRYTAKQAVIISFNYESIKAAKKALPDYTALWLVRQPVTDAKTTSPSLDDLLRDCRAAKLDGLDLNFNWPLDKAAVKRIKDAGLQLHVWTVNDPAVARRWVGLGVDGITTDRPGWLREQLNR